MKKIKPFCAVGDWLGVCHHIIGWQNSHLFPLKESLIGFKKKKKLLKDVLSLTLFGFVSFAWQEGRDCDGVPCWCGAVWGHPNVLCSRNPRPVPDEAVCGHWCRHASIPKRWCIQARLDKSLQSGSGLTSVWHQFSWYQINEKIDNFKQKNKIAQ